MEIRVEDGGNHAARRCPPVDRPDHLGPVEARIRTPTPPIPNTQTILRILAEAPGDARVPLAEAHEVATD